MEMKVLLGLWEECVPVGAGISMWYLAVAD